MADTDDWGGVATNSQKPDVDDWGGVATKQPSAPAAPVTRAPWPAEDMSDPVTQKMFNESNAGKFLNAARGDWYTRTVQASDIAFKNALTEGGRLGPSDDAFEAMRGSYKSVFRDVRSAMVDGIVAPAAAALDAAFRTANAGITGTVAFGGGLINEISGAGLSPEHVARDAADVTQALYINSGITETGIPIPQKAPPTLLEVLTARNLAKETAPIAEVGSAAAKAESTEPVLALKPPVKSPMFDEKTGNLNLKYVDSAPDVKTLQGNVAQATADESGVVISNKYTKEVAQQMHDQALEDRANGRPNTILDYGPSDPANGAMSVASRMIVDTVAKEAVQHAVNFAKSGDPRDQEAALDAMFTLMNDDSRRHEISATLGRGTQSHQITVGSGSLETAVQKIGQSNMTPEDAVRLMGTFDNPQNIAKFAGDIKKPSWADMGIFYVINNYLSGPITHGAYAMAGEVQRAIRIGPETYFAELSGRVRNYLGQSMKPEEFKSLTAEKAGIQDQLAQAESGKLRIQSPDAMRMRNRLTEINKRLDEGSAVMPGEVAARFYGAGKGYTEGLRAAGRLWKTGEMQLLPGEEMKAQQAAKETASAVLRDGGSPEEAKLAGEKAYNKNVFRIRNPILERAEFMDNPLMKDIAQRIGQVIGLPSRAASAIHTFQKFSSYFESMNAFAYRQAAMEGLTSSEEIGARMAQIKANPTVEMMQRATQEGKYASLVEKPGHFGQGLEAFAHTNNWTMFIAPFARIATNITAQAFLERTPVGLVAAKVYKLFGSETELYKALSGQYGGAAFDTAVGKMVTGTSIATIGGWLRTQGFTTGAAPIKPSDRALAYMQGNPPDSVRIGDHNYALRLFSISGRLMSLGGDMADIYRVGSKEGLEAATGEAIHSIGTDTLRENCLSGLADFIEAVVGHDKEQAGRYAINAIAAAAVPYSVGLSQITRTITDPYMRSAMSRDFGTKLKEVMESHVPFVSNTLYPQVDILGRPMLREYSHEEALKDPLIQTYARLGFFPNKVEDRISGVRLTEEQYHDYATKAGVLLDHGARALINDPDWHTYTTEQQAKMLHGIQTEARGCAKQYMLLSNPEMSRECSDYNVDLLKGLKTK